MDGGQTVKLPKFNNLFGGGESSSRPAASAHKPGKTKLSIESLSKFHSSVFVSGAFYWKLEEDQPVAMNLESSLVAGCNARMRPFETQDGWNMARFEVQALLVRPEFPPDLIFTVSQKAGHAQAYDGEKLQKAVIQPSSQLYEKFIGMIEDHQKFRRIIDLGGRARSGYLRKTDFRDRESLVFDIVQEDGVDVVGDAHEMSAYFAPASIDAIMSVSVFEHLIMPWKAAVEMNRVLRPGGLIFVSTHQTVGMHDRPWDYYRFSDTSWKGIFNKHTGFEIVETDLTEVCYVLPFVWAPRHAEAEQSCGFKLSCVLARKTGESTLDWPAKAADLTEDHYPE